MWGKDGYDMMSPVPMRAKAPVPSPSASPDLGTDTPGVNAASQAFGPVIELVPPRGLRSGRIFAVVVAVGGLLAGFLVWGVFSFLEAIFSIWGSEQTRFPLLAGGGIAVLSLAVAVYFWRRVERVDSSITVHADHMTVSLPEWRQPLVVPRSLVRLVAIDDRPMKLLHQNERFPIEGTLPPAVFADALDRSPGNPWDPKPSPVPADPVPEVRAGQPDPAPVSPDEISDRHAGWASVGSRVPPPPPGRPGHLYSAAGSALPIFVYNENDIPNVAIVFTGDIALPRRSLEFAITGGRRSMRASTARRARGIMLRARNGVQAHGVFDAWGVVRAPRADDVLSAGLRPPKPLAGMRLVAAIVIFAAPLLMRLIFREW